MNLGELISLDKENPHFYHVHTFSSDEEKWNIGNLYSTEGFNRKGNIINAPKRIREFDFERIRSNYFTTFPSRYSCLFLSENICDATYWAKQLYSRTNQIQILEVELLKGRYVCVDEMFYNIEHFLQKEIEAEAQCYWSGDETINNPLHTILFEGDFKVTNDITL